jgi:hypothetical protein
MRKLSLLFLAALALGSCKKNDDNSPSAPSKTDLLTAKSWRVIADKTTTIVGINASTTEDNYASAPACERDDFIKFGTDKTATYNEGADKCSSYAPQTTTLNWNFNSAETELVYSEPNGGGGFAIKHEILELTTTTLRIRITFPSSSGGGTKTEIQETTYSAF